MATFRFYRKTPPSSTVGTVLQLDKDVVVGDKSFEKSVWIHHHARTGFADYSFRYIRVRSRLYSGRARRFCSVARITRACNKYRPIIATDAKSSGDPQAALKRHLDHQLASTKR